MDPPCWAGCNTSRSFNGSTVREPWLWPGHASSGSSVGKGFNGSTVREPWLCFEASDEAKPYQELLQWVHGPRTVVMSRVMTTARTLTDPRLQWVHGPRTVVMQDRQGGSKAGQGLQWVHGPRTVVMRGWERPLVKTWLASMGPRSENRGYGEDSLPLEINPGGLQWVHGPRTVVMVGGPDVAECSDCDASMGPRSENRGYGQPT